MASLRATINAKCKQCSYDPADTGTWRMQVERCGVPDCPLYPVRPLPTPSKETESVPQERTVKGKVEG